MQTINISCTRENKPLFANISFHLHPTNILLVQGPNGSGKSSLLRLLAGLATPTSGDILWQDRPLQHCRPEFSEAMHYIGHTNGIKLGLTVSENLQLASHLALTKSCLIDDTLTSLQLLAHKNTLAENLSAGQKRRLSLAKLFLIPKKLWILDEPLTALDIATQTYFLQQLEKHLLNGGIAVVSSHHPITFKSITPQTLSLSSC